MAPPSVPADWPGGRVRALRERHGWTQQQMADALGLGSYQRVSEFENGKREVSGTIAVTLDYLDTFGALPPRPEDS